MQASLKFSEVLRPEQLITVQQAEEIICVASEVNATQAAVLQ